MPRCRAVLADAGYIDDASRSGPVRRPASPPWGPNSIASNSRIEGRFDKRDVADDAKRDECRGPAGGRAIFRFNSVEVGMTIRKYWSPACPGSALRA